MRVAVPVRDELFCAHFGKCDGVMLCELDLAEGKASQRRVLGRQASGCESMPRWLASLAVQRVLAGGIGASAQQRLAELGIAVTMGLGGEKPEDVIEVYLANPDASAPNPCGGHDHDHHHCRS